MGAMAAKRIGVWISLALAIAVLGTWLGSVLGRSLAAVWYHAYRQYPRNLPVAERKHLEAELDDLRTAQSLYLLSVLLVGSQQKGKPIPALQIARLQALGEKAKTDEMRPLIDLQVGIACAMKASEVEKSYDPEGAEPYMKAAQSMVQALGWPNYTEDTLKAAAQSQAGLWFSAGPE